MDTVADPGILKQGKATLLVTPKTPIKEFPSPCAPTPGSASDM